MHVMKDKYNIAIITGAPNYNTRVIKKHLNTGNNQIDHFVYRENKFIPNIKNFWEKKYEVVIFDNNPVISNSQEWESLLRVFTKKLISQNTSFFVIPGPEVHVNSMNKYLKIIDLNILEFLKDDNKNNVWGFSDSWFQNFYTNDSKMTSNDFESLPPQNPAFKILEESTSNNNFNYAQYISEKHSTPLLILGEKKSLRYAVWNSTDLASIKYKLINTKNSFVLDNTLNKIFNWLMKKGGNQEFIFRTDKNSYQQGEEVILSGKALNYNNNIINEGTVELFYGDNLLGSKPLFYDINKNEYKSRFWAPKPGKVKYIINMNRGLDSYEVSSGIFEVQESHVELNRIFLNQDKLKNISSSSGGQFAYWANSDMLLDHINIVNKKDNFVIKYTLRNNYFFISIIFMILTIEWLLRRRLGLI